MSPDADLGSATTLRREEEEEEEELGAPLGLDDEGAPCDDDFMPMRVSSTVNGSG